MRARFASAVGLAAVMSCTVAGFFGPLSNLVFAQINSTSPVLGIDVYAGNGTMNWSQIAATGIQFTMVKATQGDAASDNYQDPQLSNNETGARPTESTLAATISPILRPSRRQRKRRISSAMPNNMAASTPASCFPCSIWRMIKGLSMEHHRSTLGSTPGKPMFIR